VKYWEITADNLSKGGWSLGCISSTDYKGADNFGLLQQSARTPDPLLCAQMKSALHFWNFRPRFIVDLSFRWNAMRSSMFC
jgi:hypothetical protein